VQDETIIIEFYYRSAALFKSHVFQYPAEEGSRDKHRYLIEVISVWHATVV
jgi:hypothetical protein